MTLFFPFILTNSIVSTFYDKITKIKQNLTILRNISMEGYMLTTLKKNALMYYTSTSVQDTQLPTECLCLLYRVCKII